MLYFSFKQITPENFSRMDEVWGEKADGKLKEQLLKELGGFEKIMFAVETDNKLAGEIALTPEEDGLSIKDIFVREDIRDNGFGGMLLEYAANKTQDMGLSLMTALLPKDEPRLRRFFYAHGFTGREEEKGVLMTRDVNAPHKCAGCGQGS